MNYRNIPLEQQSITELRQRAQAVQADFSFGDDKEKLIEIIRANQDKPRPEKPPVIKWKT